MALIKCPDCGKEISDLAVTCINCGRPMPATRTNTDNYNQPIRSTSAVSASTGNKSSLDDRINKIIVSKMPIEVKGLKLEEHYFLYEGQQYSYDKITGLYYISQSRTVNFVTTSNAAMKLRLINDDALKFSDKGFRKKTREKIRQKFDDAYYILCKKTINSRYNYYHNQLKINGFIEYKYSAKAAEGGMWSDIQIPTSARIYADGFIEKGGKRYDLRIAKQTGMLIFGSHWGYGFMSSRDDTQIVISEKNIKLFPAVRTLRINAVWDADIIHSIIKALSEGETLC
jgi:hypothetical protein